MAHTKLLTIHSAVLTAALQQYLGTQPAIHPAVAGSLIAAVQAHIKDDPADLAGLPPDAHIVGHAVSSTGAVSLIIESETFPWSPDGLPLAQMPVFVPAAVKATPAPAETPAKPIPAAKPAAAPTVEVEPAAVVAPKAEEASPAESPAVTAK